MEKFVKIDLPISLSKEKVDTGYNYKPIAEEIKIKINCIGGTQKVFTYVIY